MHSAFWSLSILSTISPRLLFATDEPAALASNVFFWLVQLLIWALYLLQYITRSGTAHYTLMRDLGFHCPPRGCKLTICFSNFAQVSLATVETASIERRRVGISVPSLITTRCMGTDIYIL